MRRYETPTAEDGRLQIRRFGQRARRGGWPSSPSTSKDDAVAVDVITARHALLCAPEMNSALKPLAEMPPGLEYWLSLQRLASDIEQLFSAADLHDYAREWDAVKARLDDGWIPPIGVTCGQPGRGRRMTDRPIKLAVRSIALRVAGLGVAAADEQVADEQNAERPFADWMSRQSVAVYRKRLRERLASL
jgi:hypothetical protein